MVWPCKQNASGETSKQALLAKANGKKQLDDLELLQMFQYYIENLWWNCLRLYPSKMMGVMEDLDVW